jgi:hypothetical protein
MRIPTYDYHRNKTHGKTQKHDQPAGKGNGLGMSFAFGGFVGKVKTGGQFRKDGH